MKSFDASIWPAQECSRRTFLAGAAAAGATLAMADLAPAAPAAGQRAVTQEHPRLLGSRAELQALAKERRTDYERVARIARDGKADDWSLVMSLGLVAAIEQNRELAEKAHAIAMKYVNGPIPKGHVTFASDLAICAMAYDLGFEAWPAADQAKLHDYVNRTVDANVQSETHVFHNGWYGYKNWGIGLAAYAGYYENPRAQEILKTLAEDYRTRAAPALELAGEGGGWAEGYYIHYFLYEWLFFCEVARRCEGADYYALAPRFYGQRAIASLFEMLPGLSEYNSRRPISMGDGGGRSFGGDRDKALSARRILVNYHRADPTHQAIHAFNEATPRSSVGNYAYKDFLWRDAAIPKGDLAQFKLSHLSLGPGYVYARSSWADDATHFFFKCGPRFTAHQHLDLGHFLIFKHAELAGDGGHYDDFGSVHDVNYHLRSIAHSTVLVHDPQEQWPAIRAGKVTSNDGGQHHDFPHHNGALSDAPDWEKKRARHDIGRLTGFLEGHDFLYVAGDASKAYAQSKLAFFTRQIVFLRPGTFIIFDRIKSTQAQFKKTWLLQALRVPEERADGWVMTNGQGRLFIQSLLPSARTVKLASGENLYRVGDQSHPPAKNTGPAPQCRMEISPSQPAQVDYFLHVLTATDANVDQVPQATFNATADQIIVTLGRTRLNFMTGQVGGEIQHQGKTTKFPVG